MTCTGSWSFVEIFGAVYGMLSTLIVSGQIVRGVYRHTFGSHAR